jgi:hypothetical protein
MKLAVLLPRDTHRKPITSIIVVLLPSVTYLLTLPRPCIAQKSAETGLQINNIMKGQAVETDLTGN